MPMSTIVRAYGPTSRLRWSVTEQRRTVTVLFVDIVGSTRLVDRLDPEDVRALQRVYFGTVARVLRRWDGAVEKYVGDAVMALFGARTGDGWQAYRAVRAGLEIQRALDRRTPTLAPGLRVRVGVATGEAVVDLGMGHDGGHGVASGAVITLAARLQGYAPHGGVALCAVTHRAVAGLIAQQPMPAVTVAGKDVPIDIWLATGTLRPELPPADSPLLGRRRELAVARERLTEAVRGTGPRRLLLTGPRGAGRSRLLRELIRSTSTVKGAAVRWCVTACPPYPDGPLTPLVDLLRGLAGVRDTDDAATVRRRLSAALHGQVSAQCLAATTAAVTGAPGITGVRAAACWREVLLSLARRQPVVVAVDDLDRAAPALRHQLNLLLDQATADGLPLALVATGTDEVAGWASVPLRPLDAVTTGRLLHRLLRRAGRPISLVRHLIPLVGGNPGYARAYVDALDGDAPAPPPVPESVRRIVDARLDRLDDPLRVALMAATASPRCSATQLARMVGWSTEQAERALADLTGAGLLVALPTGGHRFADPVLGQVAAARLTRALQAAFARRANLATVANRTGIPAEAGRAGIAGEAGRAGIATGTGQAGGAAEAGRPEEGRAAGRVRAGGSASAAGGRSGAGLLRRVGSGRARAQGSAVAPELGHHLPVLAGHRDVVDPAAPVPGAFGGAGEQQVTLVRRTDEGDLATGGDGHRPVAVAGEREGGVGEQEHEAAVGDAMSVDHLGGDPHAGHRGTVRSRDQLDAEPVRGHVGVEHLVRGGALRFHLTPEAVRSGGPRPRATMLSPVAGAVGIRRRPLDHRPAILSLLQILGNNSGQSP